MKTFLCIDAGTTKIKAALTTIDSKIIDTASMAVKVTMPESGSCEMDMNELWDSLCQCIQNLYSKNENIWNTICGVGVCAQGDGAWMIDQNGQPVRPAILWNDTRKGTISPKEINELNQKVTALNATPLFSGAFPVIVNWVKQKEPENYSKIKWVLHCKDWINYKLTGNIATDQTDASTAAYDIFHKTYQLDILDWLDISEMKACLPRVLESNEITGYISKNISGLLKIPENTPVIAGAIDILATATGNNLMKPGQKGSILGTTLGNFVVLSEEAARQEKVSVGSVLCHTQPHCYIRQMSALSGASALDWVRDIMIQNMPYPEIETEMHKVPIGSDGVLFLPYLYGERAPFRAPDASGAFVGLRVYHSRYQMMRASYEGVAMTLYDCYKNLPGGEKILSISGGASSSDFICQMISDCMGETVVRNETKELGILGVSYLLAQGTKHTINMENQNLTSFSPDPENHEKYMEIYKKFLHYKEMLVCCDN